MKHFPQHRQLCRCDIWSYQQVCSYTGCAGIVFGWVQLEQDNCGPCLWYLVLTMATGTRQRDSRVVVKGD